MANYIFKILKNNNSFRFYLYPGNNHNIEIGRSYKDYDNYAECKAALDKFRMGLSKLEYEVKIDRVDGRYIPKLINKKMEIVFERTRPYFRKIDSQKWLSIISEHKDAELR